MSPEQFITLLGWALSIIFILIGYRRAKEGKLAETIFWMTILLVHHLPVGT